MKVPSFDLTAQYADLRTDLLRISVDLMASGHFILGENVKQFEAEVAGYLGAGMGLALPTGAMPSISR